MEQQHSNFTRHATDCGIVLVDIDLFKHVNDSYGHLTGDKVLTEFATLLVKNVRKTDHVGRWGGEEFIVICPNIGLKQTEQVTHKLADAIRAFPFSHGEKMSASFGVTSPAYYP